MPIRDFAIAIVVMVILILGIRLLPVPAVDPWPGSMAISGTNSGAGKVADGAADSSFAPVRDNAVHLPVGAGIWIRLYLARSWNDDDPPLLVLRNVGNRAASLYIDRRLIGMAAPAQDQGSAQFRNRTAYFRLPHSMPAGTPLYVYLSSGGKTTVFPAVEPNSRVYAEKTDIVRLFTGVMSVLLTMSIASLMFSVVTRERIFLLFASYTFAQTLYVAFSTSEAFDWPVLALARQFGYQATVLAAVIAAIGVTGFVKNLLQDSAPVRNMAGLINGFNWAFGAVGLGAVASIPLQPLQPYVSAAGNLIVLLWSALMLVIFLSAARRGSRPATLMIFGWGIMWFSTIARADQFLTGGYSPLLDLLFPGSIAIASISMALSIADQWLRQRVELHLTRHAADTDGLTKVLNRRAIEARLRAICSDARHARQSMALLFIDLDHFKLINDRYGHSAGDACLQAVVAPIRQELRSSDSLGRWGGEEFVVLLPGADAESARNVAERIRSRLADLSVTTGDTTLRLTASIGVAALGERITDADALVNAADEAVYRAKRHGRNRVALFAAQDGDAHDSSMEKGMQEEKKA